MAKPGPPRKPNLTVVKEGNPGHRTQEDLARGLKLKPGVPAEPDWSTVFVARAVVVPRRRANELPAELERRERRQLERRVARDEAKLAARWASEVWRKAVRILDTAGVLSDIDWLVLEDLAITAVRIRQAERDVSMFGLRQEGERGWQRNGSITTATQYRTHFRWLAGELGLSPVARDGLAAPADPGGAGNGEAEGTGTGDFDV